MKRNLMNAAKALANRMECAVANFDRSSEKLEEGFALIRADEKLHSEICKDNELDPKSVELVFMCLKPEFAEGRKFSKPHKHSSKSLTAVIPLTRGGTFLPKEEGMNRMVLEEGECFIEGNKPHAFGMVGEAPFIAALAVMNLEESTQPIRVKDGEYKTSMLEVVREGETFLECR